MLYIRPGYFLTLTQPILKLYNRLDWSNDVNAHES